MVSHRPSSKRGRQTDDRGAVSEPGLVFDVHQAEGPHEFHKEIGLFIVQRRTAETRDRLRAVYRLPIRRCFESLVAGFLDSRGDPLERPIPSFFLPRRALRFAVEHLLQAPRVVHHLNARRSLAAQSAFADGMARVALDVDHLAAACRDHLATADAAEWADGCRSGCAAGFKWRNCRAASRLRQGADRNRSRCYFLEELAARLPLRLSVCSVIVSSSLHLIIFVIHLRLQMIDWCWPGISAAFKPRKTLSSRRSILANLGRCLSEVKTGPLLYFGAIGGSRGECRGTRDEAEGFRCRVSAGGFGCQVSVFRFQAETIH